LVRLQVVKQHRLIVYGTWWLDSSVSAALASSRLAMLGAMRAVCVCVCVCVCGDCHLTRHNILLNGPGF
jgi:hypothetical protein